MIGGCGRGVGGGKKCGLGLWGALHYDNRSSVASLTSNKRSKTLT